MAFLVKAKAAGRKVSASFSSNKSGRSDATASSASTARLGTPSSPPLSSLDAAPGTEGEEGTAFPASSPSAGDAAPTGESVLGRARSASLQKGAAVLRALSRAPEDPDPITAPGTPYPESEDNERSADSGPVPGKALPRANGHVAAADLPSPGLSDEAKESGRVNREGLRRRGEQKEVEKALGGGGAAAKARNAKHKPAKSWEVPRKLFHGSMGFWVLWCYLTDKDLKVVVRAMSTFLVVVSTADVIRLNYPPFEAFYEKCLGALMREAEKKQVNGVVPFLVGVITCLHFFPEDIACVSVMMLSWADTAASTFGRLFGRHTPPLPSPPFASRKSSAGFLAAVIVGTITAFVFWGTPIALAGERAAGVSWRSDVSVFGTATTPGWGGSGWSGLRWGFRAQDPALWAGAAPVAGKVAKTVRAAAAKATGGSSIAPPAMPLWLLCVGAGLVAGVVEGLELGGVDDNLSLPIGSAVGIHALLWGWGKLASYLWA